MNPRSMAVRSLLGLSGLLLVAACSSGGSTGSAQAGASAQANGSAPPRYGNPYSNLDANAAACKLLTQDEVANALTQTLNTPTGTDTPRAECHYVNSAGFGVTVEIIHTTNAIADLATRKADNGKNATDLAGVGEAAYSVTGRRMIEFVKGDSIVNLYTESRPEILTPDEFVALAKLAAGRVK